MVRRTPETLKLGHDVDFETLAVDICGQVGADLTERLLQQLTTSAAPRNREIEAEKARERARKRFG